MIYEFKFVATATIDGHRLSGTIGWREFAPLEQAQRVMSNFPKSYEVQSITITKLDEATAC
jgi:hypothetical protein